MKTTLLVALCVAQSISLFSMENDRYYSLDGSVYTEEQCKEIDEFFKEPRNLDPDKVKSSPKRLRSKGIELPFVVVKETGTTLLHLLLENNNHEAASALLMYV